MNPIRVAPISRWFLGLAAVLAGGSAGASHIKGYDLSHTISTSGVVTFVYKAYHVNNLRYPGSSAPATGIRYLQFGDGQFQGQSSRVVTPAFLNCLRDTDGKCRIEYSDCDPPGNDARLCDTATTTREFSHLYNCTAPTDEYLATITRASSPTSFECCRSDDYHNIPTSSATSIAPQNAVFPCCENPLGDPNSGPVFTAPPVFNAFRNVRYLHPLGASDLDGDPLTLAFLGEATVAAFNCASIPCAPPPTPNPITLTAYDPCQTPTGAAMGFAAGTRLDWDEPQRGSGCDQTRLGFYGVGTAVTDTCGATAEREYRIELFEEPSTSPPTLTLAPHVPPGLIDICIDVDVVTIDVTASDADLADTVTLSVAPTGVTNVTFTSTPGNPANGLFTFAPKSADTQLGTHGFTFIAQDDGTPIRTTQESIQIVVIDCTSNLPPIADAGGPYVEECGGQPTSVQLDGTRSSDPEMDPLTYEWFTDCSGGGFDDDTIARPILTLSANPPCPIDCTVTLRVTDPLGGSSSDTDSVTLDDSIAPTPSATPADETVACDAVPVMAILTGSDDCDPMVTVLDDEQRVAEICPDTYQLERAWILSDACGNSTVVAQTVTVEDMVSPVLSGLPPDASVVCAADVPAASIVAANDNCDPMVPVVPSETPIDVVCPNRFTLVREWSAADRCANAVAATRTVTVNDGVAPVLTGVPADATVECDAVPAVAAVTADDGCDGGLAPTFTEVRTPGTCPNRYTLERTWSAVDLCGNAVTASHTLSVVDTTPPALSGVPADATVECDAVPSPPTVTAIDGCDPSVSVTYSESVVDVVCTHAYTLLRTWTAVDACGNDVKAEQRLRVVDATAPVLLGVPADVTAECDAVPPPASPPASDNCDPAPVVSLVETRLDGACDDSYTLVREWTARDVCGNVATAAQRVTVVDTALPIARALLEPLPPASSSSAASPAPLPPRPPAPASSACPARSSGTFKVTCGGSDSCDPTPSLRARFRVTNHDVVAGVCSVRVEDVDVLCDEVVALRLLAPPCPARGATSPAPPVVVVGERKLISGESIVLQVLATDRCGNEGLDEYDPTLVPMPCPLLSPPPDPKCKVPPCGGFAATAAPPPEGSGST